MECKNCGCDTTKENGFCEISCKDEYQQKQIAELQEKLDNARTKNNKLSLALYEEQEKLSKSYSGNWKCLHCGIEHIAINPQAVCPSCWGNIKHMYSDIEKQNITLKDKLHRRNLQIADLKKKYNTIHAILISPKSAEDRIKDITNV
jgi:hypothetical protein